MATKPADPTGINFPVPVQPAGAKPPSCSQKHLETLSKRQYTLINRNLADIDEAISICDMAEACGDNCDDDRAYLEEMRQSAMAYKANLFPGMP